MYYSISEEIAIVPLIQKRHFTMSAVNFLDFQWILFHGPSTNVIRLWFTKL